MLPFAMPLNVEHGVVCIEPDEAGLHIVTVQNVEFFV